MSESTCGGTARIPQCCRKGYPTPCPKPPRIAVVPLVPGEYAKPKRGKAQLFFRGARVTEYQGLIVGLCEPEC